MRAAGILLEDDASGKFTHNIVCANLNEGVAVHGRAHPAVGAAVVLRTLGRPAHFLVLMHMT